MASNRSHLSVEVLEDRLVPSTFPSLDGLAADLLRFLPQDTASVQLPATTNSQGSIGGFGTNFFAPSSSGNASTGSSGFSGATGQTNPNLFGFGPVDQGIPGLTATAGPANFAQTTAATTGQTAGLTPAQVTVLTQFAAARLAAAQLLAIESAQTPTTSTTTATTTTTPPSSALLAEEVFFAQLQAARFAEAAAQAQAAAAGQTGTTSLSGLPGTGTINLGALQGGNTSAGGGGVFSNNGTAINPFLPAGGFPVAPATGAGAGVFSGLLSGAGTNAALPANGFPVAGTTQPGFRFTSGPSVFGTGTQTTGTNSTSTTSSQGGMNPFNNALNGSGFNFV